MHKTKKNFSATIILSKRVFICGLFFLKKNLTKFLKIFSNYQNTEQHNIFSPIHPKKKKKNKLSLAIKTCFPQSLGQLNSSKKPRNVLMWQPPLGIGHYHYHTSLSISFLLTYRTFRTC